MSHCEIQREMQPLLPAPAEVRANVRDAITAMRCEDHAR